MTVLGALGMLAAAAAGGTMEPWLGAVPKPMPCQASAPIMPAFTTARPWRWLGACPAARAEGAGVLVLGTSERNTFFVGRMHAGRPVAGMLYERMGLPIPVKTFTAAGVAVQPDGDRPAEQHAVFVLASRAALATSQWLAAHGNRAGAGWYRDLSREIREGEPE